MSKKAADLIARLRYPDDSIAVRLEAATVLEWQAKEIRHLAHPSSSWRRKSRKPRSCPVDFLFLGFLS